MAALTWRSVEAPSLYTSLEGTRLAAGLLDRAVSNAQSGLTGFDRAQDELVGNQLALSASRIQDPTQLRTAMADGSLTAGLDTRRITPAQLLALQTRVGTLQTQNETAYNFDRTQNQNAAMDAAGQAYQDALAASRSGDTAATNRTLDANKALFAALPLEQQRQLSTAIQNQESNFLRDSQGRFNLNKDQQNHANQQAATAAFTQLNPMIGSNQDIPLLLASEQFKALPAPVQQGVIGMLEQRWGPIYGPSANGGAGALTGAGAAGAGAPGGAPTGAAASAISNAVGGGLTVPSGSSAPGLLVNKGGAAPGAAGFGTTQGSVYDAQYGYGKYGAPDKAPSQMTLGEAETYGNKLIGATKGKIGAKDEKGNDLGTSALGAYQIVNGTREAYAKQLFGKDWRNVQFTPEVQDKLGEAIFKDTKGDPAALQKQWTSLTPETAKQVAGLPWEQARQIIAKGESGAVGVNGTSGTAAAPRSMAEVNTSVADTLSSLAQRNSQNNTGGVANVRAAANDLRSDEDVAEGLVKKFPGVGKAMLLNEISRIKRTAPGVTAAQAAAALENGGLTASEGAGFLGWRAASDWMTGEGRWGDFRPNTAAITDLLAKAVGPEADRNAGANFQVQQAQATLTAYSQQANAAYNEMLRIQQIANPALRELALPAAINRWQAAKSRLEATQEAIANNPDLQRPKSKEEQEAARKAQSQPGKASPNDAPPALVTKEEEDRRAAAMLKARLEYQKGASAFGTNRLLF